MVERSQYLKVAAKVYGLTRKDSSLVVTGHMQGVFPLTGLLPPTFKLNDLKTLYASINYNKNKLIEILLKHRPTVIITSHLSSRLMSPYEKDLPDIIEGTNLYTKVGVIEHNLDLNYGYKAGLIYRLIDFK
jgi:hypothetical protein